MLFVFTELSDRCRVEQSFFTELSDRCRVEQAFFTELSDRCRVEQAIPSLHFTAAILLPQCSSNSPSLQQKSSFFTVRQTYYIYPICSWVRSCIGHHIIVPGSSTNVVYRADDRNDEHDDMMIWTELFIISVRVGHITTKTRCDTT